MSPRLVAALVTASIVSILLTTTARTQPLPGPADTLGALLGEVRALRITIEAVASAAASGQLTLGRLQLQEHRVNGVIDRLDGIRQRITAAQGHDRYQQNECTRLEATLKDPSTLDPPVREEVERGLKACPADLAAIAAEIQELTAEEGTLAAQLSAEQAKWSDVNRRLEEIEVMLTRRR